MNIKTILCMIFSYLNINKINCYSKHDFEAFYIREANKCDNLFKMYSSQMILHQIHRRNSLPHIKKFNLLEYWNLRKSSQTGIELKVLSFNIWGFPFVSKDKCQRLMALANMIETQSQNFDLILLNEVWMRKDHKLLYEAAKRAGFYMTEFNAFNSW